MSRGILISLLCSIRVHQRRQTEAIGLSHYADGDIKYDRFAFYRASLCYRTSLIWGCSFRSYSSLYAIKTYCWKSNRGRILRRVRPRVDFQHDPYESTSPVRQHPTVVNQQNQLNFSADMDRRPYSSSAYYTFLLLFLTMFYDVREMFLLSFHHFISIQSRNVHYSSLFLHFWFNFFFRI